MNETPLSAEWMAYVKGAFVVGRGNDLLADSEAEEFAHAIISGDVADAEAWVLSVVFRLCQIVKDQPTHPSIAVLETLARAAGVIP